MRGCSSCHWPGSVTCQRHSPGTVRCVRAPARTSQAERGGGIAAAAIGAILGHEVQLPEVRADANHDERQRSFGELEDDGTIGSGMPR